MVQAAHRHHGPLAPLGLMDGGYQRPVGETVSGDVITRTGGHVAHRNPRVLQSVQIGAGDPVLHAVEQQGNLSVAGDDAGALQKPEQFPQLTTLVMGRRARYRDDRRVGRVGVRRVGGDEFVMAE